MIGERLTGIKKLVCRYDPAFCEFTDVQKQDYNNTLDISKLGSLNGLSTKKTPTIFECNMLTDHYDRLISDKDPDPWSIFSTHVLDIKNCSIEIIKSNYDKNVLDDKMRDLIAPNYYIDIANQIMQLVMDGKDTVFFSTPGNYLAFESRRSRLLAASQALVPSAAAKTKKRK